MGGKKKNWIRGAIKKPGSLLNWFRRNRKRLKRLLGFDPITKRGDINDQAKRAVLRLAEQGKIRITERTKRRLRLAITLDKLRRRR